MAEIKFPVATDSVDALHDLIGDDATATFENDPKFIESNPSDNASSEHVSLRDTDDTEDSDEEDDEDEDEDDAEDEDEDFEDEEVEDEEIEALATYGVLTPESNQSHRRGMHGER